METVKVWDVFQENAPSLNVRWNVVTVGHVEEFTASWDTVREEDMPEHVITNN
jgi:hypothetical protein